MPDDAFLAISLSVFPHIMFLTSYAPHLMLSVSFLVHWMAQNNGLILILDRHACAEHGRWSSCSSSSHEFFNLPPIMNVGASSSATVAYPREFEEDGEETVAFIPPRTDGANSEGFRAADVLRKESATGRRWWRRSARLGWWGESTKELWIWSVWRSIVGVYNANVGLLLIALSQLCGSCMNISVKILNGLDPPVPPFEVSGHTISHVTPTDMHQKLVIIRMVRSRLAHNAVD